jgi:2-polyprenyl-6-hydroxyphenyl methylase/3-demethylubiquinone-9 3-methyltransferase
MCLRSRFSRRTGFRNSDQKPQRPQKVLEAAYDEWHLMSENEDHDHSPWHELIKAHLRPDRDISGRRVLEIGCGRGGFSCWLARQVPPPKLTAADFSASALRLAEVQAHRHGLTDIHWQQDDIQQIASPDASYDTVISCETIEHVPDPVRAVRELARVLRPGGRLYLTTPNYFSVSGLYRLYCIVRGRPWSEAGQPFAHWMMLPWALHMVRQAGLLVRAVDGIGHWLPWPGRPVRLHALDRARSLTKWLALHSLIVGERR